MDRKKIWQKLHQDVNSACVVSFCAPSLLYLHFSVFLLCVIYWFIE